MLLVIALVTTLQSSVDNIVWTGCYYVFKVRFIVYTAVFKDDYIVKYQEEKLQCSLEELKNR